MATVKRSGKNLARPDWPELVWVEHDGFAIQLYASEFDKMHFTDEQWNTYINVLRQEQTSQR